MKPRSGWLALCSFALAALSSYPVHADVVGPEPATCPDGSVPSTCHGGPFCYPATCSSDADCDEGETCKDASLCTEPFDCGGGWGGSAPSTNVLAACGSGCAKGTCSTLKVCQQEGGEGGSGGGGDDYLVKGCTCSVEKAPTLGLAGTLALVAGLLAFTGRRRSRRRTR